MRISDLARAADVGVETVRFYQRRGLLAVPPRPAGATRSYSRAHLERVRFIRRARQLGFSLEDVAALLKLSRRNCADVQVVAQRKLALVHDKLDDLMRLSRTLEGILARCSCRHPSETCPIIETLAEQPHAGLDSVPGYGP